MCIPTTFILRNFLDACAKNNKHLVHFEVDFERVVLIITAIFISDSKINRQIFYSRVSNKRGFQIVGGGKNLENVISGGANKHLGVN